MLGALKSQLKNCLYLKKILLIFLTILSNEGSLIEEILLQCITFSIYTQRNKKLNKKICSLSFVENIHCSYYDSNSF